MDSIGAEVGQKMRSAIKAKLMELNCYVDDELPDYIMVMVANKRSKSQMNEDLKLFLASKTETFVDWLHIVLKKLKEVTVTNPEVYKKVAAKRKTDDSPRSDVKVKKEKKEKSKAKKQKKKDAIKVEKSLTDDLPVNAQVLAEKRKVVIMQESQNSTTVNEDNFDIPPLSAVQLSTSESELADIERQIKNVKSRLGLIIESESEDDDDFINLKAEPDELFSSEHSHATAEEKKAKDARKIQIVPPQSQQQQQQQLQPQQQQQIKAAHTRITFNREEVGNKKKSALQRLGKRRSDEFDSKSSKKGKTNGEDEKEKRGRSVNVSRKAEIVAKPRESALSRLGVLSKVHVPEKQPEAEPPPPPPKGVPSVVKVKPRVIPPGTKQANKNLLLKAVAEAQRSVTQTPSVGNNLKPDALFTKRYKEKLEEKRNVSLEPQKPVIRNLIVEIQRDDDQNEKENTEVAPKSIKDRLEPLETKQKFIITLDGVKGQPTRKPSPIIFDKVDVTVKKTVTVPDFLPQVKPSLIIKNKERCRYWPGCKQGEKCEFVHPSIQCKLFPQCKFGENCLYIHPSCKFESSCTRKDCPYSHASKITSVQTCKFFPNCTNIHCSFYHPKVCKFGKFCKNQTECQFAHVAKGNFIWKSTA